jgi:hypothetical protein
MSQSDLEVLDVTENQAVDDIDFKLRVVNMKHHSSQQDLESCFSSDEDNSL